MYSGSNFINLWFTRDKEVCEPRLIRQYMSVLAADERDRMSRFRFEKDRHQFLVTRAALRTILSKYQPAIAPSEWIFDKNPYGRPYICARQNSQEMYFNLSHSKNMIVIAISNLPQIGIDVEASDRMGSHQDVARSFFSETEVQQMIQLSTSARNDRFIDLWTLKEAYIKACGMGLSIPLNEFSFIINSLGDIRVRFDPKRKDIPSSWNFWQILPGTEHKVAMALKSNTFAVPPNIKMMSYIPMQSQQEVLYPVGDNCLVNKFRSAQYQCTHEYEYSQEIG
ncbi:MAG: 4'-phosphopantetheinyl transferase family protein [Aestuariibacter sp.]